MYSVILDVRFDLRSYILVPAIPYSIDSRLYPQLSRFCAYVPIMLGIGLTWRSVFSFYNGSVIQPNNERTNADYGESSPTRENECLYGVPVQYLFPIFAARFPVWNSAEDQHDEGKKPPQGEILVKPLSGKLNRLMHNTHLHVSNDPRTWQTYSEDHAFDAEMLLALYTCVNCTIRLFCLSIQQLSSKIELAGA